MSQNNIPLYQVDAFTERAFGGNPAAVCPLDHWPEDARMQAIAAENNLSETAFFVPRGADYELRWFTPTVEVDLCGHATLATGHVVLEILEPERDQVRFHSKSGALTVKRQGDLLEMDFPNEDSESCVAPPEMIDALEGAPIDVRRGIYYMAVFGTEREVRELDPDMRGLRWMDRPGVICTAPGDDVDFVSRFFAPKVGIPEDPVTGSAHCLLTPYWAERLDRPRLHARQISSRGGELYCELRDHRVAIAGRATLYMQGEIKV